MIAFHYGNGRVAGETMTVAELRGHLAKYADDMPVFIVWEGVRAYVAADEFYVDLVHKGVPDEGLQSVLIDANKY